MSTSQPVDTIISSTEEGLLIHPEEFVNTLPSLQYQYEALCIEDVCVDTLVQEYGTPLYVYSKQAILSAYEAYENSFAMIDHQICYAVKANSNLSVLKVLVEAGAGFDIVSRGELARVLAAGGDAKKVVFSGVGKTKKDIEAALQAGIGCFNVESVSELELIQKVARRLDKVAPISLRVNPNVDAGTHPYISTGLRDNKFGITHEEAVAVYQQAAEFSNIQVVGIDCHIGSQLTEVAPFLAALDKVIELVETLQEKGITLEHIDLGGGLGVRYIDETPVSIADFAEALLPKLQALNLKLFLEPGRSIVANAGILLTQVDVLKPTAHKNFAIVDAAMNDLIRPALYQAQMAVLPAVLPSSLGIDTYKCWEIVGAICETGDFLAKQRLLSLAVGDVLAITGAGAYGFVMSSNYNTRARAAEVMVSEDQHWLIRPRETIEQLFAQEQALLS
ncbi:diaminopimelate decarboxylase [Psychrobacter sp. I-STPA6b]|uniref:diaminopimelate decarboxylase n=1 Tax=Psychrobacter sp. I-STPA6b TaxID=2585718 RepID=UPI001D0C34DE|nr:diaminopimelate decarboxylase [Psychrobacter sp. I-STPA6b]